MAEITAITFGRHRRPAPQASAEPRDMPDIAGESATRFGILLEAARRGNRVLAAEMLLSIPTADLEAIEDRLERFGIDLGSLTAGAQRMTGVR